MRRLQNILDAGDTVLSGWCGITDLRYLETIAEYDFDAIVLDMQHGFFDETSVQNEIATLVARGWGRLWRRQAASCGRCSSSAAAWAASAQPASAKPWQTIAASMTSVLAPTLCPSPARWS